MNPSMTVKQLEHMRDRLIKDRHLEVVPEVNIEAAILHDFGGAPQRVPAGFMIDVIEAAIRGLRR